MKSIGCVGVHAIGLNSWTGTEGSPVSSLKCDRRQRLNLESCLTAVCATSGILIGQVTELCHGTRAVACWATGLLPARLRAPDRRAAGQAGLPGSCVAWCKRNKAGFEAGHTTKYITRLSVTHISRTHTDTNTHTHTHSGLRNGPTYLALAL